MPKKKASPSAKCRLFMIVSLMFVKVRSMLGSPLASPDDLWMNSGGIRQFWSGFVKAAHDVSFAIAAGRVAQKRSTWGVGTVVVIRPNLSPNSGEVYPPDRLLQPVASTALPTSFDPRPLSYTCTPRKLQVEGV